MPALAAGHSFLVILFVVMYRESKMDERNTPLIGRLVGPVLGAVAFVVYLCTLNSGPCPGVSAGLLAQYAGLIPQPTPSYPLWGALVKMLAAIPLSGLAFRVNLLSAVCGALSVWFLYKLVAGAIYATVMVTPANERRARMASMLAGMAAALFLAFSIPFWTVSNRAHNASFDILFLLGVARLFSLYLTTSRNRYLYWFVFLYGLGVVEFATFIVFAPLFAVALLYVFVRNEVLDRRLVLKLALSGLAGLSLYFIDAWFFYGTSGCQLRGYTGYWHVVWIMWRDQLFLIGRSLPRSGWLVVLMTTSIPWLTCLLVARRALNDEKDWTYYVLHVILTGLAIGVLMNMKFAPWPMLGSGRLLVTPYVLMACVFGYLVAYWYLLPASWWTESEGGWRQGIRNWLGVILLVPCFVLLCRVPFMNVAEADARRLDVVNQYAQEIVHSLDGRTWLITDGVLDDVLLVTAKESGINVKLLNVRGGNSDLYMKYVGMLFDNARYRNLARIGMMPLLRQWMMTEPAIEDTVAVMAMPDLWTVAGFVPVPNKLVFVGVRDPKKVNRGELVSKTETVWDRLVPRLKEKLLGGGEAAMWARFFLQRMSLSANNLGVFLEDMGDTKTAYRIYSKARDIDANNLSAAMNQLNLVGAGLIPGDAAGLKSDLDKLVSGIRTQYNLWSLSQTWGYVRVPELFAEIGWMWALSGQPGAAISELKKAMELLSDDRKAAVKQALASLYVSQKDEQGEALFTELLMENPENQAALLGMARVAWEQKDLPGAEMWLAKAEKAGVPSEQVELSRCLAMLMCGELDKADSRLGELIRAHPDWMQVWPMRVLILVQRNDQEGLEKCIEDMKEVQNSPLSEVCDTASGYLSLMRNDFEQARVSFEKALARRPDSVPFLELLLRLDMIQSRKDAALRHVKMLLGLSPDHAFGNYILATIQITGGEYELAEDSLRKSLETRKIPEAYNDLAWVLQWRGAYDEAEKMARSALQMNDRLYQAWDTLGVILMKAKRLDEAEKAFDKAFSMFQDDMSLFVHMAELQALKGNGKKALELANRALERPDTLSSRDSDKAQEIRRMVEK